MAGVITDVQTRSKPGFYDVQNIIDALRGRKGQDFVFKEPVNQRTVMTIGTAGVKASPDLGVTAPTRVLVDAFDLKNGMIVMWNGTVLAIPTCWRLCDGSLSTPDMRDRFAVGAGTTYALGDTGGSATINLSHSHSHLHAGPSHTHTGPSHTHTGPSHQHEGGAHVHVTLAHNHSHNHTVDLDHNHAAFNTSGPSATETFFEGSGASVTVAKDSHNHEANAPALGATSVNASTDATNKVDADTSSAGAVATTFAGSGATGADGTGATGAGGTGNTSTDATSGGSAAAASLPPYTSLYFIQRAA